MSAASEVKDVLDAVQTINAGIDRVRSAPTTMPDRLDESLLPCALTYVGVGSHNSISFGTRRSQRIYIVRLYVVEVNTGTVNANFEACLPFLALFRNEYATWEHQHSSNWLSFEYLEDSGVISDMPLHGNRFAEHHYWGIEFTLEIAKESE